MMDKNKSNRRSFLKTSTLGTVGTMSIPAFLGACSNSSSKEDNLKDVIVPEILASAPDGKPLKAGLIGCGGRGAGAAVNFIEAGNGLQITALGDVFKSKIDITREVLKEKGQNIPVENCFVGFDAYRKVIDSDVDVILLCTPPVFRPIHFEYAIQKGKHCFVEKPCAVDPVGARKMLMLGKQAAQQNLSVMSGLVMRYQKNRIETYRRVAAGAIGELISAHISRFSGVLWFRQREKDWDDMTYMLHNWINFCWLCGDHIVENFIHETDLMRWFMGDKIPIRAEGVGARHRAPIGDMYDFFSVEYLFDNDFRAHCTNRKMDGCDNKNITMLYGSKGYTNCWDKIFNLDGTVAWAYPFPKPEDADQSMKVPDGYAQELIQMVTAIRSNNPMNDIERHVHSILMAMMGRESAYTGKFVTWDQIMASDQKLGPDTYEFGPIPGIKEEAPIPGVPPKM